MVREGSMAHAAGAGYEAWVMQAGHAAGAEGVGHAGGACSRGCKQWGVGVEGRQHLNGRVADGHAISLWSITSPGTNARKTG